MTSSREAAEAEIPDAAIPANTSAAAEQKLFHWKSPGFWNS
jgi:hypothetical protein